MSKKKITLQELQVKSFMTELEEEQLSQIRGGAAFLKGRRFHYRTRWTSVDTRSDAEEIPVWGGKKTS